jgi:dihydropteroate synthase
MHILTKPPTFSEDGDVVVLRGRSGGKTVRVALTHSAFIGMCQRAAERAKAMRLHEADVLQIGDETFREDAADRVERREDEG